MRYISPGKTPFVLEIGSERTGAGGGCGGGCILYCGGGGMFFCGIWEKYATVGVGEIKTGGVINDLMDGNDNGGFEYFK